MLYNSNTNDTTIILTMALLSFYILHLHLQVDYIATFQNEDDTSEPVLLWSSRKMTRSGSSAQLADLALLDADVQVSLSLEEL